MSLQDQLSAAQAKLATDQAAVDADNAEISSLQAAIAKIQPNLDLITQMENELNTLLSNVDTATQAALQSFVDSATAILEQMRTTVTGS